VPIDPYLPNTATVSPKTITIIAEVLGAAFTGTVLKSLLATAELSDGTAPKLTNKLEIVRTPLLRARAQPRGRERIMDLVCQAIERREVGLWPDGIERLAEALSSDGFELVVEGDRWTATARVLPAEPAAAPLSREITSLEAELDARGYTEALERYRAAVRHFAAQEHTSANAQLRVTLESLVVNLAVDHVGYVDTRRANQGGAAIRALRNPTVPAQPRPALVQGQPLPDEDGGLLLQGVWGISHTGGPHPGASDAQEARTRMQLVTAVAQILLRHFPRVP
jgi:hypothetical protein